jgi:hypothetical protein
MGYGIIDVRAWNYGLEVPAHASYGEIKTGTHDVSGLPTRDINIQCALTAYDLWKPGTADTACIGIERYVENGAVVDFTDLDSRWIGVALSFNISSYRVRYKISANGGWMRGNHTVYLWGDTDPTFDRTTAGETTTTEVVFDDTDGTVRHIHQTTDLGGPVRSEVEPGGAVEAARAFGHGGSLDVVTVPTEQLRPNIRVDLSNRSLVTDDPRS